MGRERKQKRPKKIKKKKQSQKKLKTKNNHKKKGGVGLLWRLGLLFFISGLRITDDWTLSTTLDSYMDLGALVRMLQQQGLTLRFA